MKRTVIYALAVTAMAMAAVSCTQEAYPETTGVEKTFTASHVLDKPEGTDGQETLTRTVLGDNGAVLWSPKDEVSIFKGSGSNGGSKFTSQNSAPAETVEFKGYLEGLGDLSEGECYWAIYPYAKDNSCDGESITAKLPANQTAVKGSFAKGCHPAIARTTGTNLRFYAIAGGLEFTVTRSDIKAIIIKGNNNEALAGTYKASFGADGKPVIQIIDAQNEVTLTAPDGEAFIPGESYIMSLLPATISKGIMITLIAIDNEEGTVFSDKAQEVKRSVIGVLKDIDSKSEWPSPGPEPEAVDLGLSVKWATFNVGATKPEEYGDYFAWGETEPYYNHGYAQSGTPVWKRGKETGYSWASYKWCNGTEDSLIKYNYDSSFGAIDNNYVLDLGEKDGETIDDAARANWGASWHMPSLNDWWDLQDNCTWKWTDDYNGTGVAGYIITSNIIGYTENSIFLPAAGCREGLDLFIDDFGPMGSYWSSEISFADGPYSAYSISIYSEYVYGGYCPYYRCAGYSVRPVLDLTPDESKVTGVKLDRDELTVYEDGTAVLTAIVTPARAANKAVKWSSSDYNICDVDNEGVVYGVKAGNATITAKTVDGGYTASCSVTVLELPHPEAVDLGLPSGLKWATFNVGATKPEEYGDYFAWGETEPYYKYGYAQSDNPVWKSGKEAGYDWSSYKWCDGPDDSLTKYNYDSSYGAIDNNYVLDLGEKDGETIDDAARANWGGSWRLPTLENWQELIANCTWEWTDDYNGTGIVGYVVTSNISGYTDKAIFLSLATSRYDTSIYDVGTFGNYWSSSLCPDGEDGPLYAYFIEFDNTYVDKNSGSRCCGMSVRPVTD